MSTIRQDVRNLMLKITETLGAETKPLKTLTICCTLRRLDSSRTLSPQQRSTLNKGLELAAKVLRPVGIRLFPDSSSVKTKASPWPLRQEAARKAQPSVS